MLKRTSKHHQPAHLAAAVAVGIVVGLVPKANLLAVGLYAALLLLPIHTWLALAVSILVACTAGYLDPLTHATGSWLLRQPILRPLWFFLDNTALLPWLGLHNTVVLGSFVSGLTLAGPTYLISLRLFDRMRWRAPVRHESEQDETIYLAPQPAESAIVPPPKFVGHPAPIAVPMAAESPDIAADEGYEPAHTAAAIINSWHMGQAADRSLLPRIVSVVGSPVADASANQLSTFGDSTTQHGEALQDDFPARSFDVPSRPPRPERSEIVDSLDLAHNASEILAWVDEMLEDCLSEDSTRLVACNPEATGTPPAASTHSLQFEPPHQVDCQDDGDEERWLMETTIEVVRWGEDSPPALRPNAAPTPTDASQVGAAEMAPPASAPEKTPPANSAHPAVAHGLPPRESHVSEAAPSQPDHERPGIVRFVQSGAKTKGTALPQGQSHGTGSTEAQRGECLGYLLGHLRQEREGRSS